MGEVESRQAIERFWRVVAARDREGLAEAFHDDFVAEWPQSGERVRGRENWLAIDRSYPGIPSIEIRRIVARGDLVVTEERLEYGGETYQAVSIFELRDGRIARLTEYFAQPFEAPAWRSQWVERIEE